VAKKSASKVSAQWSNEDIVHQILVELLNGQNVDTNELLRKVYSHDVVQVVTGRKQLRSYD
jgi:hypothetical protein